MSTTSNPCQPLHERELRALSTCACCHQKIGNCGMSIPMIWKVTAERHILNIPALTRQNGLGQMLGHGGLAMVMGADEPMTQPLTETPLTFMICDACATSNKLCLMATVETASTQQKQD
jgi:hypothetical protein